MKKRDFHSNGEKLLKLIGDSRFKNSLQNGVICRNCYSTKKKKKNDHEILHDEIFFFIVFKI